MTNVHTSKFCKRHFAAKIPFVLPGSGYTVFAQSPTKDDTRLVMRMIPCLLLQDIIAEFIIDRPSLCLIIREFLYLVFNKKSFKKNILLNRRGLHFFWLPFSILKGFFCGDFATDFDSDDDDDDRLDNEDTTRERSWFPVCCIAFGHPGVTCYTLIHSLNCWGLAHNTQYIYISDTRGSLTIVYYHPIQWYTNSPTAGLVGKTICWGNNMFDLYNCLHTLVFFKVINSVPESMESSVTQSIQIYPENHEFDENILSTERGGWD